MIKEQNNAFVLHALNFYYFEQFRIFRDQFISHHWKEFGVENSIPASSLGEKVLLMRGTDRCV
jgi:hypothetical protein